MKLRSINKKGSVGYVLAWEVRKMISLALVFRDKGLRSEYAQGLDKGWHDAAMHAAKSLGQTLNAWRQSGRVA